METSKHERYHSLLLYLRSLIGLQNEPCEECNRLKEAHRQKIALTEAKMVVLDSAVRESGSRGWGTYRTYQYYPSVATIGQAFNAYCSEAGVQCTYTMDPTDFKALFHFTNVGDRLVRIEYDGQTRWLEPGESVTLKANGYDVSSSDASNFPNVRAFHKEATG